ncbi:Suppressor of white apricot, putative isoform 2 [Hibiscus syriacus]|uniref:Suppressor of white apricot, putative isoform 2 n=1 Tax=Hibiscus syriacus TaxID=106335 RepID=A0A6A2ZW38_HIBSY|nr:Suppressor of white apricot, putative isoform 2 [Hibiscus syriacus]
MWHEARRSERKVQDMMDAARKRAQRRAIYLAKRRGDPQQSIQVIGSRCRIHQDDALYHATQDQQGLFDGRTLLDFIREPGTRHFRNQEKSEKEEEVEEFVNFERYRDLIKHRRRGCRIAMSKLYEMRLVSLTITDEDGLQHVNLEMEAKVIAPFQPDRSQPAQSTNKGSYSQVGFSYDGSGKEEFHFSDVDAEDDEEEEDEDFNSDDSNDEGMDIIAKEFGVKRYGWLVYMDKKAKEEEKRQKEVIKGDPAIRKLSRKERRKASQIEREREREAARMTGARVLHNDPYRVSRRSPTYDAYPRSRRSRSRSYSPPYSRRHAHGSYSDDSYRSKPFWLSSGQILEALHVDPASGVSLDKEKSSEVSKPTVSGLPTLAKLTKASASGGPSKQGPVEKKETPQERLKMIMNRQFNKQKERAGASKTGKTYINQSIKLPEASQPQRIMSPCKPTKDDEIFELSLSYFIVMRATMYFSYMHSLCKNFLFCSLKRCNIYLVDNIFTAEGIDGVEVLGVLEDIILAHAQDLCPTLVLVLVQFPALQGCGSALMVGLIFCCSDM